jgi:hypothetical protein
VISRQKKESLLAAVSAFLLICILALFAIVVAGIYGLGWSL